MRSKEYRTVQILKVDYDILKEYCELFGYRMGKFLGRLIQSNCGTATKKPEGRILRVSEPGK